MYSVEPQRLPRRALIAGRLSASVQAKVLLHRLVMSITWLFSGMLAWCGVWFLSGSGNLATLLFHPHPFLHASLGTPVVLGAVFGWALAALLTYMVGGLLTTALFLPFVWKNQLAASRATPIHRQGLLAGLATALWLHGSLFIMVPIGMNNLPVLNHLPIGLLLLGFLAGGSCLGWRALAPMPSRSRVWVLLLLGAVTTAGLFLPHDLLRAHQPAGILRATEPRLVLVSFDALRRDEMEKAVPQWRLNEGIQTVTAFPSTRLAWEALLGSDTDRTFSGTLAPTLWDLAHPERLSLVAKASALNIRTAFAINDSLSPSYGLEPNLFTTVAEPEGGWKYWFSYGSGTTWPFYSWAQNYLSSIETSNPWNDADAWFRDLDRLLENHQWLASHHCGLHSPVIPTLPELQAFDPWLWAGHAPATYCSYESDDDHDLDTHHWRESWRSDGKRLYSIRAHQLLAKLVAVQGRWAQQYPALSGVILSDHGEGFPVIFKDAIQPISHGAGLHGFGVDDLTLTIPLHPFGVTVNSLHSGEVWSLINLRESIDTWLVNRQPLVLRGEAQGWAVQVQNIQATHFIRTPTGQTPDPASGITTTEIAFRLVARSDGSWADDGSSPTPGKPVPVSSALISHDAWVLFNPIDDCQWHRQEVRDGKIFQQATVSKQAMAAEVACFKGRHIVANALN